MGWIIMKIVKTKLDSIFERELVLNPDGFLFTAVTPSALFVEHFDSKEEKEKYRKMLQQAEMSNNQLHNGKLIALQYAKALHKVYYAKNTVKALQSTFFGKSVNTTVEINEKTNNVIICGDSYVNNLIVPAYKIVLSEKDGAIFYGEDLILNFFRQYKNNGKRKTSKLAREVTTNQFMWVQTYVDYIHDAIIEKRLQGKSFDKQYPLIKQKKNKK